MRAIQIKSITGIDGDAVQVGYYPSDGRELMGADQIQIYYEYQDENGVAVSSGKNATIPASWPLNLDEFEASIVSELGLILPEA